MTFFEHQGDMSDFFFTRKELYFLLFFTCSPLFCGFELVGFLCTYISVLFMMEVPTNATCFLVPITFKLGFSLVIG